MELNNRLSAAFGSVQAEDALKESARAFVQAEREKSRGKTLRYVFRPAAALACMMMVFFCGYYFRMFFEPTTIISIDINPSIELGVNSVDRVVSVEAFNEDGRKLVDDVQLRFLNYEDAVNRIVSSEIVTSLIAKEEELVIAVVGEDTTRNAELCSSLESYTDPDGFGYCYSTTLKDVENAHSCGMSYGKYLAYQEALKQDSTITLDEIQDMTMKEIRELTEEPCHTEPVPEETEAHHGHNGKKHKNGHH